jgi:hypothetical protein
MAFGQINKWLEEDTVSQVTTSLVKREYPDHENEGN